MAKCFLYKNGGGTGLNFKVEAYASEDALPATAKENTIAVITDTAITSWIIDANEPATPEEGMVWIGTGTRDTVKFDAISNMNSLQVYPLYVMQYIDGAWVAVTAMIYQGGEWVEWWNGVLFDNGNQYEEITGGWWKNTALTNVYSNTGTATVGDTLYIYGGSGNEAMVSTKNKISFNGYKTLYATFTSANSCGFMLHENNSGKIVSVATNNASSTGTYSIDVSAIENPCYITFSTGNGRSATISKVWLES